MRLHSLTLTLCLVACGSSGGSGDTAPSSAGSATLQPTASASGSTSSPSTTASPTSSDSSSGGGSTATATAGSGPTDAGASTSAGGDEPRVRMVTPHGDMVFEILTRQAPITTANFLRYVDDDRYTGAHFYRTVTQDNQPGDPVKIEVIQGGLGPGGGATQLPPIEHETTEQTGIEHLDGTLSMARAAVGTASSEFFVCIGPQPELDFGGGRNPDGQGFAAFGHMVEGQAVARTIQSRPATGQDLSPTIPITSITRE